MFAEAVADFDKVEARAYSGSELVRWSAELEVK